jgi:hypothetical protein
MAGPTLQTLTQHAMSLVSVGVAIAGVVVVALNSNLSKWTWVVLAGFLVQALVVVASAATTFSLQMGTLAGGGASGSMIGAIFMVIRAGGLFGWLLIIGGLWAVFSDIQRRLAT